MDKQDGSEERLIRARGRRGFFQGIGGAVAGAALGGVAFGGRPAAAADLDVAILQFALNLEYLEAEFYHRAAFGNGLMAQDTGPSPGGVTGGSKVPWQTGHMEAYAVEIAAEEKKHVQFLRAVLTSLGQNISEPAIDLQSSFATLGQLAGLGPSFNPFASEQNFLLGAYVFEDVGVTAYHGAASLITDKNVLDKAAGILATEAYHAGLVRTLLFIQNMGSATQAISDLRTQLDGTKGTQNVDDIGVGTVSQPSIADVSNYRNGSLLGGFPNPPPGDNAIAFDRTTRQVLNIVYGGPNTTSGLFFPAGLNGMIKS